VLGLDVYVGINLTGNARLPHATVEGCLFNRMGSPIFDQVAENGANGNWDTKIDIFDDGASSDQQLTATIGGTGLNDKVLLVTVSVDVCCLRYPGSVGIAGLDFRDPTTAGPLVVTPDTPFYTSEHAPVTLGGLTICGI
jgi:hypothetical protein